MKKSIFILGVCISFLYCVDLNIGSSKAATDTSRGEKLYKSRCATCHGSEGQTKAYGTARKLKDLSGAQISAAIIGYANNPDYGGTQKHIMQPFAVSVSYRDVADIISYIKGETPFQTQENNPRKPTKQGVYIE